MRKPEQGAETQLFRQHQYLAREGEWQDQVYRLLEGWACRFRLLGDGRRQITGLFLPGDYCEPQWLLCNRTQQPVIALSTVRATVQPLADLEGLQATSPEAAGSLMLAISTTIDRQTDWIVSLGRKTAIERVSELICGLFDRMAQAGLVYADQCAMPLTQIDLADITGLTPVHVNRVLQDLRSRGLLELQAKWLHLPDPDALRTIAGLPTGGTGSGAAVRRSARRAPPLR